MMKFMGELSVTLYILPIFVLNSNHSVGLNCDLNGREFNIADIEKALKINDHQTIINTFNTLIEQNQSQHNQIQALEHEVDEIKSMAIDNDSQWSFDNQRIFYCNLSDVNGAMDLEDHMNHDLHLNND